MAKLAIPKTKSSTHFTHFSMAMRCRQRLFTAVFLTHQQAVAVRGRSATLLRVPRLSSVYASRKTPTLNDTTAFVLIMLYISMTIKYTTITTGIFWRASRKWTTMHRRGRSLPVAGNHEQRKWDLLRINRKPFSGKAHPVDIFLADSTPPLLKQ